MSEYIHQDDAYAWLRDKEIQFAEDDFAKVQVERDQWKALAIESAEHLYEALYSDEWNTREYAIAFYSRLEKATNEA
jgi:hypothetical protein